jgi:hypothetical protein
MRLSFVPLLVLAVAVASPLPPSQVHLAFAGADSFGNMDGMAVSWATGANSLCLAVVTRDVARAPAWERGSPLHWSSTLDRGCSGRPRVRVCGRASGRRVRTATVCRLFVCPHPRYDVDRVCSCPLCALLIPMGAFNRPHIVVCGVSAACVRVCAAAAPTTTSTVRYGLSSTSLSFTAVRHAAVVVLYQ